MERDDMIKRLGAGEKAIDLSIEKWEDILDGTGSDDGGENCACCYVDVEERSGDCGSCPINGYEIEQWILRESPENYDDAFFCSFCRNLPHETDKEGVKKAIEYMKRVKKWMIEKGEY